MSQVAVHDEVRNGFREFLCERIAQLANSFRLALALFRYGVEGSSEAGGERDVLGPRAQSPLLHAAEEDRSKSHAIRKIQSADAVRTVQFIGTQTHQVHAERVHERRQVERRLPGISVKTYCIPQVRLV